MNNQYKNKTKSELLEEISELKSEVKQLQNKLTKLDSATEFETIAATVLDGLFILSKSGFQSVNETLTNMLGYKPDELLKLNLKDVVAPSHLKVVSQRAELRLAGKDLPRNYDVNLLHKNGKKIIPVTLNVGLLKTKKENVIVGIVTDNSEKIKVKKELRELKNKFNTITNSAADGIIILTDDYKITYWNKTAERIFGYNYKDTEGKNLLGLIFPNENRNVIENKFKARSFKVNTNTVSNAFETIACKSDGQSIPVEISTSLGDSENEHDLILIVRDISDRKEKEKHLSWERNLTQYFMDYIPFSIYFKDLESRFIKANKTAVTYFGFSNFEQLIGKKDHDIFSQEHADAARDDELELINGKETIINKIEKETWRGGSISWVNTTKVPLKDENGKIIGTLGISADFTQIKNSELIQQTLLKISTAVNTVEEMDDLYSEIHQAVKTLMKADNFYIALYDENTKILSFPYFVDQFDLQPVPRIAGKGLTEYILRSGKAHLIDAELDMALRKLGETNLLGEPSQIWLGVPLKIGDKTIGTLVVQDYEEPKTYGQEELRILTYVCEQIASAIMKKNSDYKLKSYSAELQELNASKDKFFSIVAHDLKSPFQGLMGLSRLIVEDYD
ncbi:MAG: PAS domain S-box protein, partial [Ignavibacteriaceae bacterium]|nr:PAS domain S-box protein [Ignavibacteriaceae bacterium]